MTAPTAPTALPGGAAAPNRLLEPLDTVLARAPADWAPLVQAWRASPEGQRR